MYRYLLFAYSQYYPSGGMNDCELKFNTAEEIDFDNLYLDDQFYEIYDTKKDLSHGINLHQLMLDYEEENISVDYNKEIKVRKQYIKELIEKSVN